MMALRINVKLTSTAEGHVLRVQLAMMVLKIKEKLTLIVEDHVLHAHLAMTVYRIKMKLVLTVEDHVLRAKVCGIGPNDISITKRFFSHIILSRSQVCVFCFRDLLPSLR